ncbi:hypothetical protein [Brevundimonas sp.]|uniref:hypothetical protein n=1 Tax=Brevundimonas sp. TaxID=1871086 RepID=UPI00286AE50A|nr:hypothetical protein [Brevundimonas sp.]
MDRRQAFGGALALGACASGVFGQDRAGEPDAGRQGPDAPGRCEIGAPLTDPQRRVSVFGPRISGSGVHRLSPDGRTLAIRDYRTLIFMSLDGGPTRSFPLEGPSFGVGDDEDSIAWSDDSQSLWLLKGDTARSGFSTGPRVCARRWVDGRLEDLPALRDAPGRLDQVRWLTGAGLGIASFDTRGGSYRPELPSTAPCLGVIEASTGRVRSQVSVRDDLLALFDDAPPTDIYCKVGPGAVMHDGRARALVTAYATVPGQDSVGGLVLWTEGRRPTVLPGEALEGDVAFADGGRKLLVRFPLEATGVLYERRPSPPRTPVSGDYAGLYDLARDRWVWRLSGRSTDWGEGKGVAVSASGRKALIGLLESCDIRSVYGLIDVRTGRILRRLASYNNALPTLGFDGEEPWTAWGGVLDLYGGAA